MKKKILKGLKYAGGALVVLVVGFYVYVQATCHKDYSSTPLPAIAASKEAEVIKRGEYVVHALAHCSACHGAGEFTSQWKLPDDLSNLSGGYVMKAGPFGTFYPANLTPDPETGIAKLTDAQLARVIRHGVAADGSLYPFMSFAVGPMADEDLIAAISYLRSIKPVKNAVPKDEWGFVAKALAGKFKPNSMTAPAFVKEGPPSAERGDYLTHGPALCAGCHSPYDFMDGLQMKGAPFSGGLEPEPDHADDNYEILPPNITAHPKYGVLANFNEDQFVQRFKTAKALKGSIMPWENFSHMTEDDLRSIYRYITTKVPPSDRNTGPGRRKKGSFKPG